VARAINPVSGTNWEGCGVIPDIEVPAADAFDTAYRATLEHVRHLDTEPATAIEAAQALDRLSVHAE
jgi:C-terminal processing protease CtpA/Prc